MKSLQIEQRLPQGAFARDFKLLVLLQSAAVGLLLLERGYLPRGETRHVSDAMAGAYIF